MTQEIHYQTVIEAVWTDVVHIFTNRAADVLQGTPEQPGDDHHMLTSLSARIGHLQVSKQVHVEIDPPRQPAPGTVRIPIRWRAEPLSALFPRMTGDLIADAVEEFTPQRCALSFVGSYEPPLGPTGEVVDELIGHHLAEDAVQRFVQQIARRIEDMAGVLH